MHEILWTQIKKYYFELMFGNMPTILTEEMIENLI